ncbi:MAG: 5'-nucleotidase, lipoprotein e(P4) family [Gammaproteobacteria bacterium]|nr:5'-nucleotidase, lipoprotein e(P4) family [Gammaproteobacteria bacterium]
MAALFAALFLLALSSCAQQTTRVESHEMLNATLWAQSSAEYWAATRQVYRVARDNLDQALADPQWRAALEQTGDYAGLPPAIVLDLDETILDNTNYEVRIIRRLKKYSRASFADWCREVDAPAIPGAKEFLDYAADQNVAVFYYSARRENLRDCTARNLRALQLPFPDQTRLLLNTGTSKSEYRAMIAASYRILLLVGDNLQDFVDGSRTDPSRRRDLARSHAERWGREWIVLPNPMYGHWESSSYEYDYQLPREEQLRRKDLQLHE